MKKLFTFIGALFVLLSVEGQSIKSPNGDPELDQIRLELKSSPTKRVNFKLRAIKMKLWAASLQQQGVH